MTDDPTPQLLTTDELHAIDLTAQLANALGRIVGDGVTRTADMTELVHHIHVIQHTIMSQAAARAYPDQLRLLGQVGQWTDAETVTARRSPPPPPSPSPGHNPTRPRTV